MAAHARYAYGSWQTVLSTELNSLANNAMALSAAITPDISVSITDVLYIEIGVDVSYGSAVSAGGVISCWFIDQVDGSYVDGDASTQPPENPVQVLLRAVSGAQRRKVRSGAPPGTFKLLAKNDNTGQSMAASNNTIKVRFSTLKQA